MIKVTRAEADMLREKAPSAHIAIVNRQHRSKEKTYYAEENRETLPLIRKMRNIPEPVHKPTHKKQDRYNRKDWR